MNTDGVAQYLYNVTADVPVLQEAEVRQKRILDANYQAVDIDEHVKSLATTKRRNSR